MELLVGVMVAVATAAVIVGLATWRSGSPDEVRVWATAHGVALTDANRAMATYWVRLLVMLRVVGGTAGLLLSWAFDAASGLDSGGGGGWLVWVVLGWVAGSLWAETCLDRPGGLGGRASLSPRRVADYLPRHLRWGPLVAAGVVAVLVLGAVVAPTPDTTTWPVTSDALLLLTGLAALALAGAEGAWARVIVGRRQPVAAPDVVAVDEAVRANVLHHLAGGVTAAILLLGVKVSSAALGPRALPLGIQLWAPMVLLLVALVAWRWSAHRAWRVRRPLSRATAPAP